MGFKEDWSHGTPYLFFCVAVFACGDLIYGTYVSFYTRQVILILVPTAMTLF